ncbi:MAG: GvpL/GvpF family gas vesicle protein [Rhodococcus sp. (in: high G+C Gram-positive bacteria)]|uniref:GvpL/GvpF family gas vesicle protein n=1 Tax=Rhodococcus sp. TaxID=1831 RepID=UPI003BAF45D5
MSGPDQTTEAPERARTSGVYVYGIVPADVEAETDATGVADGAVSTVRHGDIAALVSEIEIDRALGTPEDLRTHARILDGTSRVAPVLPLRFGAVLTDAEAVKDELLAEHEEQFAAALKELEGHAQYVVKGRYVENAILAEILAENEDAERLRQEIRDKPEDATRDARMALGELINNTIAAKREADTQKVIEALTPLAASINVREPTHEKDAAQVAVLVEVARQKELEQTVGDLAQDWESRVEMRVLGPLAPYDFVVTQKPEG